MKRLLQSAVLLLSVLMSAAGAREVIVYAQVGETVTLKAPDGVLSHDYLYWFSNGLQLSWRNDLGGKGVDSKFTSKLSLDGDSLVIHNIKQENFGTFSCTSSTNENIPPIITYKLLQLTVRVDPPSPLLPGDSLSLSCTAETLPGSRNPVIHWLNPQARKIRRNSVTMEATSEESGKWTCVVNNEKEAQVSVTVLDLSPAPSRPHYTSKSSPLNLPCSLSAGTSWELLKVKNVTEVHWNFLPKPDKSSQKLLSLSLGDLTWKLVQKNGLRSAADLSKGNLSLYRYRAKEEDRGDYVCSLKFKNGVTQERTVHVEVLQITSSPGTEVISGQQLNLTCSLGHALPSDLTLKWIPPQGSSLPPLTPDHHPDRLTIREATTGDGGKWKCELWQNGTRLTSADVTLKIEPKLSVWMLVVICSVAAIVILVLILVFILYRRRQRKMGHLRRQLCQCKTPKPKGFYRS